MRLYKSAVDLDPVQSMNFLKDQISNEDKANMPISDFLAILVQSEDDAVRKFAEDELRELE